MSKTYKSILSKYSLVRPSFREGVARVFDIHGNLHHHRIYKKNSRKSDYEALRSDWENVGHSLYTSIHKYKSLNSKS